MILSPPATCGMSLSRRHASSILFMSIFYVEVRVLLDPAPCLPPRCGSGSGSGARLWYKAEAKEA